MSKFCGKCLYLGTDMCIIENCSKGVKMWKFLKIVGFLLLPLTLLVFLMLFLTILKVFGSV